MASITVIASLAFSSLLLVASDDTAIWKDDVSGWQVRVDSSIGNSCLMATAYDDGSIIRAQFNLDEDIFQFIVGNSKWRSIEMGKLYDISVEFGNAGPWHGQALAHYLGAIPTLILSVGFDEGRAGLFIEEFMRMTNVSVLYDNREIANLSLRGTYAAMTEVIVCQDAMMGATTRSVDPFYSTPQSDDPFR